MKYKTEKLIERLYQHEDDYTKRKTQDFAEVCADCKIAAKRIESLTTKVEQLEQRINQMSVMILSSY